MQVARAGAQKRVFAHRLAARPDGEGIRSWLDRVQRQSRGEKILLPRMRADSVAEKGAVIAGLEPIGASLLFVGPADRQLLEAAHLVEYDRALRDGRPDDRVSLLPEPVDDPRQIGLVEDESQPGLGRAPSDPGIDDILRQSARLQIDVRKYREAAFEWPSGSETTSRIRRVKRYPKRGRRRRACGVGRPRV